MTDTDVKNAGQATDEGLVRAIGTWALGANIVNMVCRYHTRSRKRSTFKMRFIWPKSISTCLRWRRVRR